MRFFRVLAAAAVVALGAAALLNGANAASKSRKAVLTPDQRAAQAILRRLSLHDRVAQLVIAACYAEAINTHSPDYEKYRHMVRDLHVGGLIVTGHIRNGLVTDAEPIAMGLFLNQMQKMARTPLLVASDFERGSSMRVAGGTPFPYNMAYGAAHDLEASRFEGLTAAREARALGVQWIFAPVSDVNNNPANPIINIRSYGENPDDVAANVAAFIDGAHSDPKARVLVSAKHFPGHGDVTTDSHMAMPRLDASRERIESLELKPFRAAIEHGADSIMTAHMAVPAFEPEDIPATVSDKVLTGLLREELKFQGLIVTDALDMQGVAAQFPGPEAAIRALQAGADVLLMPSNPEQVIRGVEAAIARGRLKRERVDESVMRILTAKVRMGLIRKKTVDLDAIADVLDTPEEHEQAQQVSNHAVTLVRNDRDVVPLVSAAAPCLVVMVESRRSSRGQIIVNEFRKRAPAAHISVLDGTMPLAAMVDIVGDTSACSAVVVAPFVTVAAYRGNVALAGDLGPLVEKLEAAPAPVVLVAMGNPYLLLSFPKVTAYLATYSTTSPSELGAVKALFGEIPITGRLPVSIPGLAKLGDGIQLPARAGGSR